MRPVLVVAVLLLAGCSAPADDDPAKPAPSTVLLPSLADVPVPDIDAEAARLWWEEFVNGTPYRHTGSPTNDQAAEIIKADLAAMGYEVAEVFYRVVPGRVAGNQCLSAEDEGPGIRAIVGVRQGTTQPDRFIGWVAHYDSNAATIYAAYDDGSGTAVAMETARVLAETPTNKSLAAIFFDGEEIGLVASDCFVKALANEEETGFDLVIGHDMTGINCPGHEWKMFQFTGENFAADLVPIETALYNETGLFTEEEQDCIVVLDLADRNSDERRFKEAGIPVVRMAGGRRAADYPEYHKPGDTVEFVYQFAGGPENYEKGLALTVKATYYNVHLFDRMPRLVESGST